MADIEGALERTWAIYGPWPHLPPVDMGTCDLACVEDPLPGGILLAWFDRWVMELPDVPVPAKPTFVSFENPKGGSRGWRELSAWLPEGPAAVTYELGSDETLAMSASASEAMVFHEPGEPTASGAALTFTTAALAKDAVLLGRAVLEFRAKLSAADANFYVEVIDVDAANKETFVNDGYLKASHRASHEKPEPVPAGEMIDYRIVVRPQHHRFVAGHKLKLRLSAGSKDMLAPPPPVDVTIETGNSARLQLPGFAAEL
ncbi:MAG TPA: CocE/NonD family hydrolase C-terminal non-catalytic domain-containing protein [Polyangiales bacterium]|nr:CocE/NonD family hydrolase C-terminal non-catalytic domain-containing protein [Polyangiales bacterium]